ncbi:hypothetical protein D3C84_1201610 [compost metagenome]
MTLKFPFSVFDEDARAVAKGAFEGFRQLKVMQGGFQQRRLPEPAGLGVDANAERGGNIEAQ